MATGAEGAGGGALGFAGDVTVECVRRRAAPKRDEPS